jgi:competence protein ComEA
VPGAGAISAQIGACFVVTIDDMELFSASRRRALAVAALLLIAVILGVRQLARRPGGAPSAQAAAAARIVRGGHGSGSKLVVHVVGAVRRPGLYRFPAHARIADAVHRAGGATRKANLEAINLAAPLEDGLQVLVPRRVPVAAPGVGVAPSGDPPAAQGPVHLNTATLDQLDALPGIGPVTAQKILDYRQEHGPFVSVDDLDAVPGIGPARMEQLRELVAP